MTKLKALVEIKQKERCYSISIHSPSIQKVIRDISNTVKYTPYGYAHNIDDIRLDEFRDKDQGLILQNGKPNLIPLFIRNNKVNKMNVTFDNIGVNDLNKYSKDINTQLLSFHNFLSENKHKFTREWIISALDYYFKEGMFEREIEYEKYTYSDLSSYLKRIEQEAKDKEVKLFD